MSRKITLLLTAMFCLLTSALAQSRTIRGVVAFAEDKSPVIGANIVVKGHAGVGVATDMDGRFTLTVPQGAKFLVVSYVGTKTQEVPISENRLTILLENDNLLEEVVVVGYGTQKKESFVGAQSMVDTKQLSKRPISNLTTALGAQTPGVQVSLNTGQPGSSSAISIRGIGSMNAGSEPLIVVDGSVYDGALADINPQDIQSFSVLKDAASTAIYGASAGNGVILITTKSGVGAPRRGGRPSFSFTMNQGFNRRGQDYYERVGIMEHYPLRWQQWFNESYFSTGQNAGNADYAGRYAGAMVFDALRYNPFVGVNSYYNTRTYELQNERTDIPAIVLPDGSLNSGITGLAYGDDLDWDKALFRTGHRSEYNFSGNYRSDRVKSYFSLGYLSEDGYARYTSFKRFSGRANVSYDVTKWLEAGTNISYTNSVVKSPKNSSGSYSSNPFYFVAGIAPIYPIHQHNPDGSYVLGTDGKRIEDYDTDRPYLTRFNPVLQQRIDFGSSVRDLFSARNFFKLTPMRGLKITLNANFDVTNVRSKSYYNNQMGDQPLGLLYYNPRRYETRTFNQLVEYNKAFHKQDLSILVGHESYEYKVADFDASKRIAVWPNIAEFDNFIAKAEVNSNEIIYRKESYLSRINYSYDSRYNFSASFRRDASSRFHKDNRWGNFWSIGLGWNIHRESFMQGIDWVNALKLRGSHGVTGNDNLSSYFASQGLYSMGWNNQDQPGILFSRLENKDLKWEGQVSSDIALEFQLFKRLSGTIELFNKQTDGLLFAVPQPRSSGVASITQNLGKVRNYGVEFTLDYLQLNSRGTRLKLNLNATLVKNRIVRLPDDQRENGIVSGAYKYVEGSSIYTYYLYDFKGVDPEDGLAMYAIDLENYASAADPNSPNFQGVDRGERATWTKNGELAGRKLFDEGLPKIQGGFGAEFNHKGWELGLTFAYQIGGKALDGGYRSLMARSLDDGRAAHVDLLNAWTINNKNSQIPRLDAGAGGMYANMSSQRFLTSRTGLMLRSLIIGYTLPQSWLERYGISSTRISLAGENLFLLSKRKGFNPMRTIDGEIGAANYGYAKTLTASLNITF